MALTPSYIYCQHAVVLKIECLGANLSYELVWAANTVDEIVGSPLSCSVNDYHS